MANVNWFSCVVLMFDTSGALKARVNCATTQAGLDTRAALVAQNPTFTVVLIDSSMGVL